MYPELKVLPKLLVEGLKGLDVLRQLLEQLETLLDEVLPDDLQDLVVLEHLTGNVEREVFRVHYPLHKVEVLGDEVFGVLHDENPADVELDVILDLSVFKEVKRGTLGDKEESTELQLSFNGEVLDS